MAVKIKKDDTVQVLSGKDRGKQGRVVRVYPEKQRAMVEGVNMIKRHEPIRAAQGRGGVQGGIITREAPVHLSNLALVCPSCNAPTRVGHAIHADGKSRVCKRCGARV